METKSKFIACKHCGKKLIERDENGLWHFVFGKQRDRDGQLTRIAPVDIYVHGSLKLRCFRRDCNKWNVFNFFPFREDFIENNNQSSTDSPSDN